MNKSLEFEYTEKIRTNVPDLWGKIEAKLDEQDAAKKKTNVVEFPNSVTGAQNDPINVTAQASQTYNKEAIKVVTENPYTAAIHDPVDNNVVPMKKKRKIPWQYFGVAVAAVLCIAVVIPLMNNMREMGSTMGPQPAAQSFSGAATTGGGDSAPNAVTETVCATADVQAAEAYDTYNGEKADVEGAAQDADSNYVADSAQMDETPGSQFESDYALDMAQEETAATSGGAAETAGAVRESAATEQEGAMKDPTVTGDADMVIWITVSEGTTEEQLAQLAKDLKKSIDPEFTITLLNREDAEYAEYADPENIRVDHIILINGFVSEEQIVDQVVFISRQLKEYDFITQQKLTHREFD